jgi:hypothetical protein
MSDLKFERKYSTEKLNSLTSVVDPDPHGSTLIWSQDPSPGRTKMTYKNKGISCFEVLDVLF